MARIRYLKPDFFDDEELCALSPFHRLCYQGLWCQADRAGRLEDRPKRLKARIFPYDDVDMETLLTDLARAGFVIRYLVDGKAYLTVKPSAWEKHQRPRNDEPESLIPAPSDHAVVYASMGSEESLGVALRKTVTDPSLSSDAAVTSERIGIGMGNGDRNGGTCAEALTRSTPVDASPVMLTFPVVGVDGGEWALRQSQVDEWKTLFPGLDVLAECRHALAWVLANPGRRKTARGMRKFLAGWCMRTVDRRGVGGPAALKPERAAGAAYKPYVPLSQREDRA